MTTTLVDYKHIVKSILYERQTTKLFSFSVKLIVAHDKSH